MLDYESTAEELVRRIRALIPEHPEILAMEDAWGLFGVPGFACDDLGPSLAQASWALSRAKMSGRRSADLTHGPGREHDDTGR